MSNEVITYQERVGALSLTDVKAQVNLIQHVMREVMKQDEHYGVIPGTGTKPSLLKAGAEKLCLTFRLDPQYETNEQRDGVHLTVTAKCTLYHIPSGQRYGSGLGSCSTRESKYAYRKASRKCPQCGSESIIKGKEEYGGGWVCFKKRGGCGAKFPDGDRAIEAQTEGRVPNEDVADQYNTVLKMACKRALVAAVLNVTAASDIFTQDIEDMTPESAAQPGGSMASSYPPASGGGAPPAAAADPAPDNGPREQMLRSMCDQAGVKLADLLAKAGVELVADLSTSDFADAVEMLERKIAKKAGRG